MKAQGNVWSWSSTAVSAYHQSWGWEAGGTVGWKNLVNHKFFNSIYILFPTKNKVIFDGNSKQFT